MREHEITIYEQTTVRTLLSISEISRFAGLHPEMVQRIFMLGLIDPHVGSPEPLFEDSVLARIDKIMRLKNDLGINLAGCGLVLDLLDKIAELEKRLRYYEVACRR